MSFAEEVARRADTHGYRVVWVDGSLSREATASLVAAHFGLG
ncbi:MAG: hypothetical protein ACFB20_06125 [Opitutales bacterium]